MAHSPAAPVSTSPSSSTRRRRVLKAFFDADALGAWWQVARVGDHAADARAVRDRVGADRLPRRHARASGRRLRGTVMQFDPRPASSSPTRIWLPPDGDPIGPMALEVTCTTVPGVVDSRGGSDGSSEPATHVRVTQKGFEESPRWRRYYRSSAAAWSARFARSRCSSKISPAGAGPIDRSTPPSTRDSACRAPARSSPGRRPPRQSACRRRDTSSRRPAPVRA